MNIIETTLTTQAVFSDDETKRYLLKKIWDTSLPKLTICMLAPSIASGISIDATTLAVLNNASALGFGSVSIVNLFATLGDFSLSNAEDEDQENLNVIVDACKDADLIIYAPGVGKNKLTSFQLRAKQVLEALRPYVKKIKTLASSSGKTAVLHPLCPVVRKWDDHFREIRISDLLPKTDSVEPKAKPKKGRPLVVKKDFSA